LDKAIADHRRDHEEFQQDFNDIMKKIVEEQRRSRKLEACFGATWRIIRRNLEK
jgi:hypothetical protein